MLLFVLTLLLSTLGSPMWIAAVDGSETEDAFEPGMIVIEAGTVITLAGEALSPGVIVIEDGKIRAVGTQLDYPSSARVIHARRETVMPALVHPRTRFQLPGYRRTGNRAAATTKPELYLSEMELDDFVKAGYAFAAFVPAGSEIPGQATLVNTARGVLAEDGSYLLIEMGGRRTKSELRRALSGAKKAIETRDKAKAEWEKKREEAAKKKAADEKAADEKAKSSHDGELPSAEKGAHGADPKKGEDKKPEEFKAPKVDPNLVPFVELLEAKPGRRVLFGIRKSSDLLHLDEVLESYPEVKGTYLLAPGSRFRPTDYRHVVDRLGEREATVLMVPALGALPYTVTRFNLAAELQRAGCALIFQPARDSAIELKRVRSRVADLVRAGLDRDAALAALTINSARLVGKDEQMGTLEKGKEAHLIFLDGDPLDPSTEVTRLLTGGKMVWEEKK